MVPEEWVKKRLKMDFLAFKAPPEEI